MGLVLYAVAEGIGEQACKLKRAAVEKEIGAKRSTDAEPRSSNLMRSQTFAGPQAFRLARIFPSPAASVISNPSGGSWLRPDGIRPWVRAKQKCPA
jgi:hypothetical protein